MQAASLIPRLHSPISSPGQCNSGEWNLGTRLQCYAPYPIPVKACIVAHTYPGLSHVVCWVFFRERKKHLILVHWHHSQKNPQQKIVPDHPLHPSLQLSPPMQNFILCGVCTCTCVCMCVHFCVCVCVLE